MKVTKQVEVSMCDFCKKHQASHSGCEFCPFCGDEVTKIIKEDETES